MQDRVTFVFSNSLPLRQGVYSLNLKSYSLPLRQWVHSLKSYSLPLQQWVHSLQGSIPMASTMSSRR